MDKLSSLYTYLSIIERRKYIILVTLFVTVAIVALGTFLATPVYSASTVLRVATNPSGSANSADYAYADRLMNTYIKIATSRPVLDELAQRINRSEPPKVIVEIIANTELIEVTVEDRDATIVAAAANILAEIMIDQNGWLYSGGRESTVKILAEQLARVESDLERARKEYESLVIESPENSEGIRVASQTVDLKEGAYADLLTQYEQAQVREAMRANTISVAESAVVPRFPVRPKKLLNLSLGLLVGMAGGLGLAFLIENLDTTLYTNEQIEAATELSALGKIPSIKDPQLPGIVRDNPLFLEAFRQLRTKINILSQSRIPQALLVTSAEPEEGKSTIVSNLAFAIAQSGWKAIIVDCNLRLPALHRLVRLPNKVGLSSLLNQEIVTGVAMQEVEDLYIDVITSGPLPPDPAKLLVSPKVAALVQQLKEQYDYVLLDTPSLSAGSDAMILAPAVDGVILVVSSAKAHEEAVRATCKQLAGARANLLGIVVNRVETGGNHYHKGTSPIRLEAGRQ